MFHFIHLEIQLMYVNIRFRVFLCHDFCCKHRWNSTVGTIPKLERSQHCWWPSCLWQPAYCILNWEDSGTNQKSGIRNPESANGSNKPSNKRLHSFWVLARKDICVVSKGITKPWSRDKHDMWSGHFWGVWAKVTPVMGNAA